MPKQTQILEVFLPNRFKIGIHVTEMGPKNREIRRTTGSKNECHDRPKMKIEMGLLHFQHNRHYLTTAEGKPLSYACGGGGKRKAELHLPKKQGRAGDKKR